MLRQLRGLIEGLLTVFKHLFMKPVTLEYPEKKKVLNENFRGKPIISEGCIGCGVCERVCPSGAIKVIRDNNNNYVSTNIDLGKCIFCGNCEYYCSKGVVKMSNNYELATDSYSDLTLNYKGACEKYD